MKHLFCYSAVAAITLLTACNENVLESKHTQESSSDLVQGINVLFPEIDSETRAIYEFGASSWSAAWSLGDTIGIYPMGGNQVDFPISDGAGTTTAKFDGGAWALRGDKEYAAYYPFSDKNFHNEATKIPVSYLGQLQDGNNTTDHLSAYDYMASAPTQPDEEGNVNLQLKRLGCFAIFNLYIPDVTSFASMTFSSDGEALTTDATVDLSSSTPGLSVKTTAGHISMDLQNAFITDDDHILHLYAMFAPVDLSSSNIEIKVTDVNGVEYVKSYTGQNMKAGRAYLYIADMEKVVPPVEPVAIDLGLPSGTKWASFNMGASAPEEFGDYYAWGEVSPKDDYSPESYGAYYVDQYEDVDEDGFSVTFPGYWVYPDYGANIAMTQYDVAHVKWDDNWQIPNNEDFNELYAECTYLDCKLNGVSGRKFTASNGKWIFLPAAGRSDSQMDAGLYGWYWTAELKNMLQADFKVIIKSLVINTGTPNRHNGYSVRAVWKP